MASRILIIEDNPADMFLIEEALRSAGVDFSTDVISDGENALKAVGAHYPADRVPDLILMDLNLPRSDARQLVRAIRSSPQLAQTPVAVLTSSESPADRAHMEELGVDAHVIKPPELDEFLNLGHLFKSLLESRSPRP